jgi:hypothetical protein
MQQRWTLMEVKPDAKRDGRNLVLRSVDVNRTCVICA